MLRSLAVASLFCLTSTIAHAQNGLPPGFATTNKSILCGPVDIVFKSLASTEINEKPIWIGQDENGSNHALFVNATTGGFTIIQFGQQVACVLGLGPISDFYPPKTQTDKSM